MKISITTLIVSLTSLLSFSATHADEAASAAVPAAKMTPRPYPLNTCIVSGDKLGGPMGEPVVKYYQGEEVEFCCKDCIKDFEKEPEKYLKILHEAAAKANVEKKVSTSS